MRPTLLCVLAWMCSAYFCNGATYTHLRGVVRAEEIGFELVHNLIIIKLQIGESDSLNFIVDTGVKTPILFGLPAGSELSFDYTKKYKVEGLGLNEPIDAYYTPKNKLIVADFISLDQDLLVLPADVLELSSFLGLEIHGLIGSDLFENFTISCNYIKKTLTLSPKSIRKKIPLGYQAFDLEIVGRRAFLYAHIEDFDARGHNCKLLVDMGASLSISIFYHSLEQFKMPPNAFESFLGRGLQGEIYGLIGRLNHFKLGKFGFQKPISFFPHQQYVSHLTQSGRNGSIGADFFVRFHWIMDYANSKLYIKSNKLISKDFGYNITGIEVISPIGELPLYQIVHLRPNSQAQQAGLLVGDQIRFVNGFNVTQMERNEVILYLQGHLSKKLRLIVLRGTKFIKVKFEVKDLTLIN